MIAREAPQLMAQFQGPEEARSFVAELLRSESSLAGTSLDEFERELISLHDEDLFEARRALAARYGRSDGGFGALDRLTDLLRQARRRKEISSLHASGLTTNGLLRSAEQALDRSSDLIWLAVHDSKSRAFGKVEKRLVIAVTVLAIAGYIGFNFFRIFRFFGLWGVGVFVALLLMALAVDLRKRRRNQPQHSTALERLSSVREKSE